MYETLPGENLLFLDDSWARWDNRIDPEADSLNAYWDTQPRNWFSPQSWVNYTDQWIFGKKLTIFKLYSFLYYYAMLTVYGNELGPVNHVEFLMFWALLLGSIFFNFAIFSDVYVIF